LVVNELGLSEDQWAISYQSKFGPEEWLHPSTAETLLGWGKQHLPRVAVIAPGFAADCLETLHEIEIELAEIFSHAGGGQLQYIPALNLEPAHIELIHTLVSNELEGWIQDLPPIDQAN
jgi:ferrochelatase